MSRALRPLALVAMVLAMLATALPTAAEEPSFGHPAFKRVWERYDKPVSDLEANRSWTWGPNTQLTGTEPYAEAPGGQRLVQYFDKSRMELNDPNADPESPWFVTNGLLATELITGRLQLGDDTFDQRWPAQIPVAGDPDDTGGPLYASFANLEDEAKAVDSLITETIDRNGTVGTSARYADYGVRAAYYVPETKHTVAAPFWEFLNASGPVYVGNDTEEAKLFDPTFFVTGFPITEAYWAQVKVADKLTDVLTQCFQRRCLTYTPANDPPWRVEMGNIGQHYHRWRYTIQAGNTLFEDDFASTASGWPRVTDSMGVRDYAHGGYRIAVTQPDRSIWVTSGPALADVRMEVDATYVAGPATGSFGLICRFQDDQNFYRLGIGSNGGYAIVKVKDGTPTLLTAEGATSPAIRQGMATNRLRVDCVGNTLALYANGQRIAQVQDAELTAGRIGLFVTATDAAGPDVLFDKLSVLKP